MRADGGAFVALGLSPLHKLASLALKQSGLSLLAFVWCIVRDCTAEGRKGD
jgi:hypothetical protein